MAKYKLSRVAEEDLIRIFQFGLKRFGQRQAEKYYDELFAHFESIAGNPYAFRATDYIKPGYRRCVCDSTSIYYRIVNNSVEIMTLVGQQDLENL